MDGSALTDGSAVVVIDVLANDSNDGMRASAIVTVTVASIRPIANDDSAIADKNTPETVPVLGNDADPQGDLL